MTIMFKDVEYPVADSLRVIYMLQKEFNHKPYLEIFSGMDKMPLEQQVSLLYVAFNLANPGVATKGEFLEYVLDNMGMSVFQKKLEELMDAIMFHGLSPEERSAKKAELLGETAR